MKRAELKHPVSCMMSIR